VLPLSAGVYKRNDIDSWLLSSPRMRETDSPDDGPQMIKGQSTVHEPLLPDAPALHWTGTSGEAR